MDETPSGVLINNTMNYLILNLTSNHHTNLIVTGLIIATTFFVVVGIVSQLKIKK